MRLHGWVVSDSCVCVSCSTVLDGKLFPCTTTSGSRSSHVRPSRLQRFWLRTGVRDAAARLQLAVQFKRSDVAHWETGNWKLETGNCLANWLSTAVHTGPSSVTSSSSWLPWPSSAAAPAPAPPSTPCGGVTPTGRIGQSRAGGRRLGSWTTMKMTTFCL